MRKRILLYIPPVEAGPEPPSGRTTPGDTLTAHTVYGFKQWKTAYSGPCIKVKDSGDVEHDLNVNFTKAEADAIEANLKIISFCDLNGSTNHLDSVGAAHPVLKFDGEDEPYAEVDNTDIRMVSFNSAIEFTAPKLFFLFNFKTSGATDGYLFNGSGGFNFIVRISNGKFAFYNDAAVEFDTLSEDAWYQATAYYKTGNDRAFLNGVEMSASSGTNAGDTARTGSIQCFESHIDNNGNFRGFFRGLVYVEGAISDGDRETIENWQMESI